MVVVRPLVKTHLDLLSIPESGGKNVKTFRWDHRLQIQNLFMAFKRVLFRYVFCCALVGVDVPLIFFGPADHVSDWRVLYAGFLVSWVSSKLGF